MSAEAYIRTDIARLMAIARAIDLDRNAINGSGTGSVPAGLFQDSTIPTNSAGSSPPRPPSTSKNPRSVMFYGLIGVGLVLIARGDLVGGLPVLLMGLVFGFGGLIDDGPRPGVGPPREA